MLGWSWSWSWNALFIFFPPSLLEILGFWEEDEEEEVEEEGLVDLVSAVALPGVDSDSVCLWL